MVFWHIFGFPFVEILLCLLFGFFQVDIAYDYQVSNLRAEICFVIIYTIISCDVIDGLFRNDLSIRMVFTVNKDTCHIGCNGFGIRFLVLKPCEHLFPGFLKFFFRECRVVKNIRHDVEQFFRMFFKAPAIHSRCRSGKVCPDKINILINLVFCAVCSTGPQQIARNAHISGLIAFKDRIVIQG